MPRSMATILFTDPRCLAHDPGPHHSESPQRLATILSSLHWLPQDIRLIVPQRAARRDELELAHAPQYVAEILALSGTPVKLDPETPLSVHSVDAARHAAGAGLAMIDAILDGTTQRGFALLRPPGHHAGRTRGGGFCVFNNIAIAASYARRRGVARTLIIDWDVHHGNGTQDIFYERDDVFFFDVHQDGLYPDTGSAEERGAGAGLGFTKNLPLLPLSGDDEYVAALERELPPVAASYRPELVLVSCGFDAHAADIEAGMSLSAAGFGRLAAIARRLADRYAGGRLGLFLEGGYLISALPACISATIAAIHEATLD
jgi:acetoin utilization deacetylase AcuC-like enzyme